MLDSADCTEAEFSSVVINGASLRSVDFRNAELTGINPAQVDMIGVKILNGSRLDYWRSWRSRSLIVFVAYSVVRKLRACAAIIRDTMPRTQLRAKIAGAYKK
jgi:uncharacterized protein YjbI with pentapeptide repeats